MGLDMYLRGEKCFWHCFDKGDERKEDGRKVNTLEVDLGYWRKHPNLHGYIVQSFADGKDECQKIELTADDLMQIIDAVKNDELPHTEGFFFGESDNSKKQVREDVAILESALAWLESGDESPVETTPAKEFAGVGMTVLEVKPRESKTKGQQVTRTVYYQASW